MRHIVKRPDTRQMDLGPLPLVRPLLTPRLNLLLHILLHLIHLDHLHTLPLRPMDLSPNRLVLVRRIRLDRVQPLFRDSDDGTPSELFSEEGLGLLVDAAPNGLEVDFGGGEMSEVIPNNTGELSVIAEGVTESDGETILGNVSHGTSSTLITPDRPCRINPRRIRRVTVLCNQLCKSNRSERLHMERKK